MKQLVCEMCGSTNLVKQEGVFVCQSCGCKYSVEEAKKMMIEGIVEVKGTVRVDRISESESLIKNADTTYEDGNYKEAFDLYSQVLSIDPDNEHAILYRAMSSAWQSSVQNCKIGEINSAAERAIKVCHDKYGDTKAFFDFVSDALARVDSIIRAIYIMYIQYYSKAMPINYSLTSMIATSEIATEVKTTMKTGVNSCCIVAHNLVNYIISITENYAEAEQIFWSMMETFPQSCITYRKKQG